MIHVIFTPMLSEESYQERWNNFRVANELVRILSKVFDLGEMCKWVDRYGGGSMVFETGGKEHK